MFDKVCSLLLIGLSLPLCSQEIDQIDEHVRLNELFEINRQVIVTWESAKIQITFLI